MLTAGALPGGLTLSAAGLISGTPLANDAAGPYSFTVTATDSASHTGAQAYSLNLDDIAPTVTSITPVNNASAVAANSTITVVFSKAVNVTASSFTLGMPIGTPVAFTLSPTQPGGATTYTLTPSASLPAGTVVTVTVVANQVSDLAGTKLATNDVSSFTVAAATLAPITLNPTALKRCHDRPVLQPAAYRHRRNRLVHRTRAGYTLTAGALPGGLTLSTTGLISGTPLANDTAGPYSFTVTATDSASHAGAQAYSLNLDANYQASHQTFEVLVDGKLIETLTPTGTSYQQYVTPTFTVTARQPQDRIQSPGHGRRRQYSVHRQPADRLCPHIPPIAIGDSGSRHGDTGQAGDEAKRRSPPLKSPRRSQPSRPRKSPPMRRRPSMSWRW